MNRTDNASAGWQQEALGHLGALYGFAMALTRDPTESEDLVQETYTRAANAWMTLRPESNLKGWLFAIMRNTWSKQLRHRRRGPQFVAFDDADPECRLGEDRGDEPLAAYLRIREREEIRCALERLPSACHEIIVLRDIEGFSYKEIAEMLDCPLGTIMSRLARARARLKLLLGGEGTSVSQVAMPE